MAGHMGHVYNEASDGYAKLGTTLPPPPAAAKPSTPWDIVRQGELMAPPHKVWTHERIPTHAHDGFHPISRRPLRNRRLSWHKWLFGLRSRVGFSHYTTFLKNEVPTTPYAHCGSRHNQSIHGFLAECLVSHPLV